MQSCCCAQCSQPLWHIKGAETQKTTYGCGSPCFGWLSGASAPVPGTLLYLPQNRRRTPVTALQHFKNDACCCSYAVARALVAEMCDGKQRLLLARHIANTCSTD
jgi:hypothetical protein